MGGGGDHVRIIDREPREVPDRDWGGADGAVVFHVSGCNGSEVVDI